MKSATLILILLFMSQNNTSLIYDAKHQDKNNNWFVVDDGVMGGLSRGNTKLNDAGHLEYYGTVRTENNGGFSSVRYTFDTIDASAYRFMVLKIKGDGKNYQFRIKDDTSHRYSYITTFETSGDWQTIKIALKNFYPSFRGNRLNRPNFNGKLLEEIAILIGNKTKENFVLEIEKIYLE
ncbi:CIA30 family protein [Cellulophaga sp. Hel_I_12]|uniref:CIA30 family protein n=1 Tax=Cellulophaga sp. Hel_I_12 TaxID=1249972 RepID=UPI001E36428F|nr:CIA30 family protein [Cellulophaga sp. Hel_I_12]